MEKVKDIGIDFYTNIKTLGFNENDDALYLTSENSNIPSEILFHIDRANEFNAAAVYFRKSLTGNYQPQVYLYDFTDNDFNSKNEFELTEVQKKIWSSAECPLACFVYKSEIKILNCTTHISDDYKPAYLIKSLKISGKAHKLYNNQFAIKIKSGIFWEEADKNIFRFSNNSSYNKLIENIRYITSILRDNHNELDNYFTNKIIVQSILIKYLEERIDTEGNELLSDKFFKQFSNSQTFIDVLKKGKFVDLLDSLNNSKTGFNGNVFQWTIEEQNKISQIDLSLLGDLLDTKITTLASKQQEIIFPNWRYFEFKYIPVELISRLYEEFLGSNKKDKGLYYTPAHLTKLLVDESLPLTKFKEIDVKKYKIFDPACGSGIFLVTAFKRLVQIWRLQNNMKHPDLKTLKSILKNIYGTDKEEQAVELASFSLSLALCNELKPLEIINKLKFDDLTKTNLIYTDFFKAKDKIKNTKFDLIIGNPPFNRGAIKDYTDTWQYKDEKVKIPQGQIALKFLSESIQYLRREGLLCLIIKSSGLLYNSTSAKYKKVLFSNFNIPQILDFTALARNKSLWENGADVATAAIFLKNEKPKPNNNILHLTFRRTKATIERIVFEIDDYDLHFVDRISAAENPYIWKNNLLGGGRIRTVIEKTKNIPTFESFLENNDCKVGEGYIIGTGGKLNPDYIYKIPTIPTEAILEDYIDYKEIKPIDENLKFEKVPPKIMFESPNIIIRENIGKKKLPIFYNEKTFSYKHQIIGIVSETDKILKSIINSFKNFNEFYRFYMFSTSSYLLINRNTALLKKDIMDIPLIMKKIHLSEYDKNIISDVTNFTQDFIRNGENSKAVKPIPQKKLKNTISSYGQEFSKVLNLIYEDNCSKFRLSDIVILKNSFIATIFKYDSKQDEIKYHKDNSKLNIEVLTDYEISKQLTVNRIIKLYPSKDTIVFIKPNQYRYWLSLIAYRDADKCFSDLSKLGY